MVIESFWRSAVKFDRGKADNSNRIAGRVSVALQELHECREIYCIKICEIKLKKIGFIGAGQMAKALAAGIAKSKGRDVVFSIADPSDEACQSFEDLISDNSEVDRVKNNQAVADDCEVVFLAVKPQFLVEAIGEIKFPADAPLIVSIVAGVQICVLKRLTDVDRIIRVMPNTPCLIGQGACAIAPAANVGESEVEWLKGILESIGTVVDVEERLMDSVTGLSGSGPAFVFNFIESLIDGAVLTGMARSTAQELAIQTVIGAAMMVKETGEHTAVLRDRVTSPGGTTIAGLKALEETGFRDSVMSAVQAATERSMELGE